MTSNQMSLTKKLHLIQVEVQKVNKGGTNNFSKYEYARLGDVLETIRPHLKEYGLYLYQTTEVVESGLQEMESGNYSIASVTCTTHIIDTETDESISVKSPGFAWDKNGDKAVYKAITGARKYGITSLFCLDWDTIDPEDDSKDEAPKRSSTSRSFKKGAF